VIRQRIEWLNKMQPESLFIRCGMWRVSAREALEVPGVRFHLWFRFRSCEPEIVSMRMITYDFLTQCFSDDVFKQLAQIDLARMERQIESCWES
jgi:hypothetical protein